LVQLSADSLDGSATSSVTIHLREFEEQDLDAALALWSQSEGVEVGQSDSPEKLATFLLRNPGLSWIAVRDGRIVGAALCGHDGRRGYIHHLAVAPSERRAGVGRALVERCLAQLRQAGILKCHIFVLGTNQFGELFWAPTGWQRRDDLQMYSRFL
jgi:ribosomal protein S18 acetylase RimI-like enzyme